MTVLGTDFLASLPVVVVIALLVGVCRWVFGSKGVRKVHARPDYGLLSPVARADSVEAAEEIAASLAGHGIRGTVAPAGKGYTAAGIPWPASSHMVLVFPSDIDRASQLVPGRR